MRLLRFTIILSASLLWLQACATVHNPSTQQVNQLNEAALADHQQGRHKDAQNKLLTVLDLARENGIENNESTAVTRLYLGIVYAEGMKRPGPAVEQMTLALTQTPHLRVPAELSGPRVDRAYAQAEKRARRERKRLEKQAAAQAPEAPAPETTDEKVQPETVPVVTTDDTTAPILEPEEVTVVEEVDVPRPLPEPIHCPLPDKVPPGQPLTVWCAIDPALARVRGHTVIVHLRPPSETEFWELPTERSPKGWYGATIDHHLVHGSMLQYYVEVKNQAGKILAATGEYSSPNLILIRAGAPIENGIMTQQRLDGDPAATGFDDDPVTNTEDEAGFDWGRVWLGLQIGTGWGWHENGMFEYRDDLTVASGIARAGLFHLLPEIGYRLNDDWAFSLQTRHQIIVSEGDTGGRPGGPAQGAHALLLRAHYRLWQDDNLAVQATGNLGVGEAFRLVYGRDLVQNRSGTDTVRGGPALLGPGLALNYHLSDAIALTFEVRALLGVHNLAALFEGNAGLRFEIF